MDIIGKRKWFYLLSLGVVIIGVVFLLVPPGLRAGIDFSGGSTLRIEFVDAPGRMEIRDALLSLGHDEAVIQGLGEKEVFIRLVTLDQAERDVIEDTLDSQGAIARDEQGNRIVELYSVSPVVAQETVRNATIAVVVAALAILAYITWAFRRVASPVRYGVCAVVALMHDVIVVLGIYALLGRLLNLEVNVMFITGMLTVVGYSVNDTVVVFDRVRENIARGSGGDLTTTVNNSLLETLGRSLNTTLTTLFVLVALLVFGGETIRPLILVMVVGITTGAYSSIAVASSLLVSWEKGEIGKSIRRIPLIPSRR